jgi:aminopeptidase N
VSTVAFPRYAAQPSTIDQAEALLRSDGLDPALRRVIGDGTDELRRSLAGRALATTGELPR